MQVRSDMYQWSSMYLLAGWFKLDPACIHCPADASQIRHVIVVRHVSVVMYQLSLKNLPCLLTAVIFCVCSCFPALNQTLPFVVAGKSFSAPVAKDLSKVTNLFPITFKWSVNITTKLASFHPQCLYKNHFL